MTPGIVGKITAPATVTRHRNSRIYTELALMFERLTGKAAPVHSEAYRRLMKAALIFFTPILMEQEQQKEKG